MQRSLHLICKIMCVNIYFINSTSKEESSLKVKFPHRIKGKIYQIERVVPSGFLALFLPFLSLSKACLLKLLAICHVVVAAISLNVCLITK